MESQNNEPKVGIGVMIFKDGKVLLGKRINSHGAGSYATPGGHLEYMESFEECGAREVREECGIEIENIRFQYTASVRTLKPKHYVQVQLLADWKSGEPQTLEPNKCEGWNWYDLNNLPENLFITSQVSIEYFKKGNIGFSLVID